MQVFLMFFAYLNESSYRRESLSTDGCCWIAGQWIEGTETASFDKQKAGVSWPSLCENRNVAFRNWTIWGKDTVDGCEFLHHQTDGWSPTKSWDVYHLSTGGIFQAILKATPCTSILVMGRWWSTAWKIMDWGTHGPWAIFRKSKRKDSLAEGCVPLPGSATPGRTAQKLIVGNRLPWFTAIMWQHV